MRFQTLLASIEPSVPRESGPCFAPLSNQVSPEPLRSKSCFHPTCFSCVLAPLKYHHNFGTQTKLHEKPSWKSNLANRENGTVLKFKTELQQKLDDVWQLCQHGAGDGKKVVGNNLSHVSASFCLTQSWLSSWAGITQRKPRLVKGSFLPSWVSQCWSSPRSGHRVWDPPRSQTGNKVFFSFFFYPPIVGFTWLGVTRIPWGQWKTTESEKRQVWFHGSVSFLKYDRKPGRRNRNRYTKAFPWDAKEFVEIARFLPYRNNIV